MVLVQSAPEPSALQELLARIHPSPARIVGVAGAVALNAALFMLLLAPMGSDLPLPPPQDDLIAVQILKPVDPPPPPPVPVPVTPPTPAPTPPVRREAVAEPVDPAPVIVEQGRPMDLPMAPPANAAPALASAVETTPSPLTGVRLEYASAPPPPYPRRQLADRVEGQVLLRVLVDVDGRPLEVTIQRSSGNRDLDRAAQQHILKRWTFRPATKDGRAVQAVGLVPIDFKLQ